jgi:hypothetical protein
MNYGFPIYTSWSPSSPKLTHHLSHLNRTVINTSFPLFYALHPIIMCPSTPVPTKSRFRLFWLFWLIKNAPPVRNGSHRRTWRIDSIEQDLTNAGYLIAPKHRKTTAMLSSACRLTSGWTIAQLRLKMTSLSSLVGARKFWRVHAYRDRDEWEMIWQIFLSAPSYLSSNPAAFYDSSPDNEHMSFWAYLNQF